MRRCNDNIPTLLKRIYYSIQFGTHNYDIMTLFCFVPFIIHNGNNVVMINGSIVVNSL